LAAAFFALTACTELSGTDSLRANDEKLRIIETLPANGATDVDPGMRLDYCFSTLVDPRSVNDFDATLNSGTFNFDVDAELQLFPWRPPANRAGLAEESWCPGSVLSVQPKQAALESGVLFRIRLRPSLTGWGGEELATDTPGWLVDVSGDLVHYTEITIGEGEDEGTDSTDESGTEGLGPEGPTLTELFDPGEVFDPELGNCSCHMTDEDPATEGLDMTTPERAYEDLVLRSSVMSTGFPMVAPRHPSESYLVHKLLRDGDSAIHAVLGDPMPPAEPLEYVEMAAIAAWIEAGAELE
jgi:hypothetical protein